MHCLSADSKKQVTVNNLKWPFSVKFCFCAGMFGALKHGFVYVKTLSVVG